MLPFQKNMSKFNIYKKKLQCMILIMGSLQKRSYIGQF
jgi:hypothetical protein